MEDELLDEGFSVADEDRPVGWLVVFLYPAQRYGRLLGECVCHCCFVPVGLDGRCCGLGYERWLRWIVLVIGVDVLECVEVYPWELARDLVKVRGTLCIHACSQGHDGWPDAFLTGMRVSR